MKKLAVWLLTLLTFNVWAQTSYGSWIVSGMKAGQFAASMNDSGGILGKYCYNNNQTCYWLLAVDVSCDEGAEYPVLLNAEIGAAHTRLVCTPIDGKNRYVFTDHDLLDKAVLGSGEVGIAFPMQSGRFKVSRFDVKQAATALLDLNRRMTQSTPKPRNNTRDISL